MSLQDSNIELIKRGYDAFTRGDMETVMGLYADDVEWVQPGDSAISGTHRGRREVVEFLGRLAEKTTELRFLRMIADGDTVVVFSEATVDGETSRDVEAFELSDGKVTAVRTYGDTALMERVYGVKQLATG
jgi:uncharacterized protein